jgi:hypothetical protein
MEAAQTEDASIIVIYIRVIACEVLSSDLFDAEVVYLER